MKVHFIDIFLAYMICSYGFVLMVLIRDGSASINDWTLGLILTPYVVICYLPFYLVLSFASGEYFVFARGMVLLMLWGLTTLTFAYIRFKLTSSFAFLRE